jgi:hypothetical protein
MKRTTLRACIIGVMGLLVLVGVYAFIVERLDNWRPLVGPVPDKSTSFVETMDLRDLVTSATPPALELKFVTEGSGGSTGGFKPDETAVGHRGVVLQSSNNRHIEYEMTADSETRAALLARLRSAIGNSLSRWQPKVNVKDATMNGSPTAPESFTLEYHADGATGHFEGEIKVAIQQVPKENLRRSETGRVIHSLTVETSEERRGLKVN